MKGGGQQALTPVPQINNPIKEDPKNEPPKENTLIDKILYPQNFGSSSQQPLKPLRHLLNNHLLNNHLLNQVCWKKYLIQLQHLYLKKKASSKLIFMMKIMSIRTIKNKQR